MAHFIFLGQGKLTLNTCKRLLDGQLLVPWFKLFHLLASSDSPLRLERHFGVSFVPIRFMIGELLSEVSGRVGHGLVLV